MEKYEYYKSITGCFFYLESRGRGFPQLVYLLLKMTIGSVNVFNDL